MAVLKKLFGFSQIVVQYLATVEIVETRVSSSSWARLHLPVPQVDLAKLMSPCTRKADLPTSARTLRLLALGLWNELNYFKETILALEQPFLPPPFCHIESRVQDDVRSMTLYASKPKLLHPTPALPYYLPLSPFYTQRRITSFPRPVSSCHHLVSTTFQVFCPSPQVGALFSQRIWMSFVQDSFAHGFPSSPAKIAAGVSWAW